MRACGTGQVAKGRHCPACPFYICRVLPSSLQSCCKAFSEDPKSNFVNQTCGAVHAATISATLRVADLLCMDDDLESALQLLLKLHKQVVILLLYASMVFFVSCPCSQKNACSVCGSWVRRIPTQLQSHLPLVACAARSVTRNKRRRSCARHTPRAKWRLRCGTRQSCAFQWTVMGLVAGGWEEGSGAQVPCCVSGSRSGAVSTDRSHCRACRRR